MREIEFRTWNTIHNSYWGWPLAFTFENSPQGVWEVEVMGSDGSTEKYYGKDLIIEQFTGLLDKNNKKIYEGDILKSSKSGVLYPIEYDIDRCGFIAMKPHTYLPPDAWSNCEILGNIHESPELLNG